MMPTLNVMPALLRGPTSGATGGETSYLALLIAGIVLLLVLLAVVVVWQARRGRSK